jgi:ATP-dependent helicase/nuclease subunit B
LLPQLVAWLAEGWDRTSPLDLSSVLAVVPTRQAGRRLREALALHAAAVGRAVFPPRVIVPDELLTPANEMNPAGRVASILAWSAVLGRIDLDQFRDLFPIDPPVRDFTWSLRLAQQLIGLQATLAESGWRLADVREAVEESEGSPFPETERWRRLAELESDYDDELARSGLRDSGAVKIAAAEQPALPPGVSRVVLLAVADPWPLALKALAAVPPAVPVEIAVFAPPEEAEAFDGWGRPRADAWVKRPLTLPDFDRQVRALADPDSQAEVIAGWAVDYGPEVGIFAIGAADPDTIPSLEAALNRSGVAVFNPEGRLRRGDGLYQLLAALADLAADPAFRAVEALARCPDFLAYAAARGEGAFSPARWLAGLDRLRAKHLPPDLESARARAAADAANAETAAGLSLIAELKAALATGPFAAGAAGVLADLFAPRRWHGAAEADRDWATSADEWMAVLRECAAAESAGLSRDEWWGLALRLFGDTRQTEDKPAGALELQGWLELLWEDAPHLAIAGCNDGRVPEALVGDPFLPDTLRERLGLKTNEARFARDAYLLQALASSRARGGRLDLLFGRESAAGDPLRPSRLLLQCPDAQLPARVGRLFRPAATAQPYVAWSRAWRLTPPPIAPQAIEGLAGVRRVAAPTSVGVTALNQWLACPFRFYLRHVLRMEPVDPEKTEMDPADFGTFCHGALEAMGREEALRDCTDPDLLREFLLGELDQRARHHYGAQLPLPLVIQVESARQRLRRAAEVQAVERAAGWRIERVEHRAQVTMAGLELVARIDRIDRHVETGAVRVLDYKTADSPVDPESAHLRTRRKGDQPREFALFSSGGKVWVWDNLQLPLYRHALAAEFPDIAACGYFNLPKAAGQTGLSWWEPYSAEVQRAALVCAEGVCAAIRAGDFWPPAEDVRPESDDYAALFHHGAAASVAWEERA